MRPVFVSSRLSGANLPHEHPLWKSQFGRQKNQLKQYASLVTVENDLGITPTGVPASVAHLNALHQLRTAMGNLAAQNEGIAQSVNEIAKLPPLSAAGIQLEVQRSAWSELREQLKGTLVECFHTAFETRQVPRSNSEPNITASPLNGSLDATMRAVCSIRMVGIVLFLIHTRLLCQ